MERPIPSNPDHIGIPEDTSTPEEKEASWQKFVALAKERGIWRED